MSKKLFILISDGGDGSYSSHFTFDADFVQQLQERYNAGHLEHGDLGVDGDGFHYSTLDLPDDSTLESIGVRYDAATDYADVGTEFG